MACCRDSEITMPPSDAVACALKIIGSKSQLFNKQCELMIENMEFGAYCSPKDSTPANYLGSESCEEVTASSIRNATFSSLPSADPNCKEVMYAFVNEVNAWHSTVVASLDIYLIWCCNLNLHHHLLFMWNVPEYVVVCWSDCIFIIFHGNNCISYFISSPRMHFFGSRLKDLLLEC